MTDHLNLTAEPSFIACFFSLVVIHLSCKISLAGSIRVFPHTKEMTETIGGFTFPDEISPGTHALKAEFPDDFDRWSSLTHAVGVKRAGMAGGIRKFLPCPASQYFHGDGHKFIIRVYLSSFFVIPLLPLLPTKKPHSLNKP